MLIRSHSAMPEDEREPAPLEPLYQPVFSTKCHFFSLWEKKKEINYKDSPCPHCCCRLFRGWPCWGVSSFRCEWDVSRRDGQPVAQSQLTVTCLFLVLIWTELDKILKLISVLSKKSTVKARDGLSKARKDFRARGHCGQALWDK